MCRLRQVQQTAKNAISPVAMGRFAKNRHEDAWGKSVEEPVKPGVDDRAKG
jgi:hypothetical protein